MIYAVMGVVIALLSLALAASIASVRYYRQLYNAVCTSLEMERKKRETERLYRRSDR